MNYVFRRFHDECEIMTVSQLKLNLLVHNESILRRFHSECHMMAPRNYDVEHRPGHRV